MSSDQIPAMAVHYLTGGDLVTASVPQPGDQSTNNYWGKVMNKHLKVTMITLIALRLMAGGIALYGNFIIGVNAAGRDSAEVIDLQDHGGMYVMPAQIRGSSDLVRTVDNVSKNIDTSDYS